jgi:hypothetical protein
MIYKKYNCLIDEKRSLNRTPNPNKKIKDNSKKEVNISYKSIALLRC